MTGTLPFFITLHSGQGLYQCWPFTTAGLVQLSKRMGLYRWSGTWGRSFQLSPCCMLCQGCPMLWNNVTKGKMPWGAFVFSVVIFFSFQSSVKGSLGFYFFLAIKDSDVLLNWIANNCFAEHEAGLNEDL